MWSIVGSSIDLRGFSWFDMRVVRRAIAFRGGVKFLAEELGNRPMNYIPLATRNGTVIAVGRNQFGYFLRRTSRDKGEIVDAEEYYQSLNSLIMRIGGW